MCLVLHDFLGVLSHKNIKFLCYKGYLNGERPLFSFHKRVVCKFQDFEIYVYLNMFEVSLFTIIEQREMLSK